MKAETLIQPETSYLQPQSRATTCRAKKSKRLLAFAFDAAALGVCIFAGAILCWLVMGAAISFDPMKPGPENGMLADASRVRVTTYVSTLISLCYFLGSWLTLSASPGQRLFGLRLYSARTGKPLNVSQALARWVVLGAPLWVVATVRPDELGALLSVVTLVWSIFLLVSTLRSDIGQGAHDRWTGSMVMSVGRAPAKSDSHSATPDVR